MQHLAVTWLLLARKVKFGSPRRSREPYARFSQFSERKEESILSEKGETINDLFRDVTFFKHQASLLM